MGVFLFCTKSSFGGRFGWIKVVESVPRAGLVAGNEPELDVSSCCIVMRTCCLDKGSAVLVLTCQSASIVGLLLVALVNSKCVFDGRVGKGPMVSMLVR